MTTRATDAIERALGGLRLEPPDRLWPRVLGGLEHAEEVDEYVLADGPVGRLLVVFNARGIVRVRLAAELDGETDEPERSHRREFGRGLRLAGREPRGLSAALRSGDARRLAYDLGRLSDFERDVLAAALEIPRGEIRPYAWVAERVGRPRAVRAVGSALGRNPVPVLIPCHRVVRSDGTIGNYGLGPGLKRDLLAREDVDLAALAALSRARVRFVGSATTHVFCWPTCRSARRISARNRVAFRSAADAERSGYRPCATCRPAPGRPPSRPLG